MTPKEVLICRNVKRFREESGLSQSELAAMVGVVENTIRKWEQFDRVPSTELLMRLASELERPVEDFGKENPSKGKKIQPPAFALKQLGDGVDDDLRQRAIDQIAKINREHLDRVRAIKERNRRK